MDFKSFSIYCTHNTKELFPIVLVVTFIAANQLYIITNSVCVCVCMRVVCVSLHYSLLMMLPKKALPWGVNLMKAFLWHKAVLERYMLQLANVDLKILDALLKDWYDLTMNSMSCILQKDTQWPSTTGDFNCGCGHSFHHQGNLTDHVMDNQKS